MTQQLLVLKDEVLRAGFSGDLASIRKHDHEELKSHRTRKRDVIYHRIEVAMADVVCDFVPCKRSNEKVMTVCPKCNL